MDIKQDLYKESVAMALMRLSDAWKNLTTLTKQDDELDLTEKYPFGYINFEQITEAVQAWCSCNAAILIDTIKLSVPNPDCVEHCPKWRQAELHLIDNSCTMSAQTNCFRCPTVAFNPEHIARWLASKTGDNGYLRMKTEDIYFAYLQFIQQDKEDSSSPGK